MDWVKDLGPAITGALGALIVVYLQNYWSSLQPRAQRLHIIDLATKRIAFWDQYLKVELKVTAPDSEEQKQSKPDVREAIQKIHSDANRELERLAWDDILWQQKRPVPRSTGLRKAASRVFTVLGWVLFLVYVGLGVVLAYVVQPSVVANGFQGEDVKQFVGVLALMIWFLYLAGKSRTNAKKLEFQKRPIPPRPTFDQI